MTMRSIGNPVSLQSYFRK